MCLRSDRADILGWAIAGAAILGIFVYGYTLWEAPSPRLIPGISDVERKIKAHVVRADGLLHVYEHRLRTQWIVPATTDWTIPCGRFLGLRVKFGRDATGNIEFVVIDRLLPNEDCYELKAAAAQAIQGIVKRP
jgi:hypothetical protein